MWRMCRPKLYVNENYEIFEIREPYKVRYVKANYHEDHAEVIIPAEYAKDKRKRVLKPNLYRFESKEDAYYLFETFPRQLMWTDYTPMVLMPNILYEAEQVFDLRQFVPQYEDLNVDRVLCSAAYYIGISQADFPHFAKIAKYRIARDYATTVINAMKAVADEVEPQPAGLRLLKEIEPLNQEHANVLCNLVTFHEEESARYYLDLIQEDWRVADVVYSVMRKLIPIFPKYCTVVNAAKVISDIYTAVSIYPEADSYEIVQHVLKGNIVLHSLEETEL